jgi:gluconolactonase
MTKTHAICFLTVAAIGLDILAAQSPAVGTVVKLDPALDAIVSANARVEMLKTDYFGISEGPVWVPEGRSGYLLFSDLGANVIYKWAADNKLSVFLEKAGYTGDLAAVSRIGFGANNGRLFILNLGANGLALDPQGRIVFTAQGDRAIVRLEKDGARTVLADKYEGKRLNRPNDLVIKSDGAAYFTDPRAANNPTMEQATSGVFLIKDGKLQLLLSDFTVPNGIAFSPDEKYLYVNDSARRLIVRYDVRTDDSVANGRTFVDMNDNKAPGNPDGMKVDGKGNVYCTGPGGIWIISPEGKHLGTIPLPDNGTNMAFGDPDYKTLYITDRKNLAKIRLNTPGVRPRVRQ